MPVSKQNQQSPEPGCGNIFLSLIGVFILFGLFSVILCISYVPSRVDADEDAGIARKRTRTELEATQHTEATTYGWVNKTDGLVRIPIERAMELTVHEFSAKQHKSGPPK